MFGAIKYNLTHLLDFSGRDARPTFWYYVLFVVLLNIAVSMAVAVPAMGQAMMGAVQAAQSGDQAAVNAAMAERMAGMVSTTMWTAVIMGVANLALLAAAFVRRLHDADFSGWWALIVAGLSLLALARNVSRIDEAEALARAAMENAMNVQQLYAANGNTGLDPVLSWVPTVLLIAFGALKSTAGANRYGTEPVRF